MNKVATTKKERQERLSDALLGRIFIAFDCFCETCPYEKECEVDNPNFDANYCKIA